MIFSCFGVFLHSSMFIVYNTELTTERSILLLLFEILKLTDLFILYFFIQNVYANKKLFKKKGYKVMSNGSNCDRKSQLYEILTEPLNPRDIQYNVQRTVYIEQCTAYDEECTVQKKIGPVHAFEQCTGQLVIQAHCTFYTVQYFRFIL